MRTIGKASPPLAVDAALKGYTEIARILLDHGARVNERNSAGGAPLHDATCTLTRSRRGNRCARHSRRYAAYNAASWGRRDVVEIALGAACGCRAAAALPPWKARWPTASEMSPPCCAPARRSESGNALILKKVPNATRQYARSGEPPRLRASVRIRCGITSTPIAESGGGMRPG